LDGGCITDDFRGKHYLSAPAFARRAGRDAVRRGRRYWPPETDYATIDAIAKERKRTERWEATMSIHVAIGPVVSLIAGILILVMPRLLNYIVAIYLIIIGLLGLGLFGLR
jgi:hypothetical protein